MPLAGALVWAYLPGTDVLWPDPLYLDPVGAVPAVFPLTTDASGGLELWAPAEAHLEVVCAALGYTPAAHPRPGVPLGAGRAAGVPRPGLPGQTSWVRWARRQDVDYTRAFGQTTVFGFRYGQAVPLAGALVWAYAPGTETPWAAPLYGDPGATAPLSVPGEHRRQRAARAVGGRPGAGGAALPGARVRGRADAARPGAASRRGRWGRGPARS